MTELAQKIENVAEAFIQALTAQREQGGWSALAHTKLSNVPSLINLKDNISQLIKGKDEATIFRKSEYLIGQLFSEQFLKSSASFEFISAIKAILDRPVSPATLATSTTAAVTPENDPRVTTSVTTLPVSQSTLHTDPSQIIDVTPVIDVLSVKQPEPSTKLKAMILLDADQLSLDRETELELEKRTNCKILYRIAFANWKSKNNDRLLHERHYLLIHLPSGKDKADGGMMIFGSSIQDHYPDVNCLFICSNDQIFVSLAMRVTQLGLQAYQLNQIGSEVHVKSLDSIESWTIKPQVPIVQLLERLKTIISKKSKNGWILLNSLEEEYFKEQGNNFQEDLVGRDHYNSLLEFLKYYPKHFVVHQVQQETAVVYVMLFRASPQFTSPASSPQASAPEVTPEQLGPNDPLAPLDHSPALDPPGEALNDKIEHFQQKLITILDTLLADTSRLRSGEYIDFTDLATAFFKVYRISINQASLEATQKRCVVALSGSLFPKIKIKQHDKGWWVTRVQ
jgi:hypothetical protein